MAEWFKAAVLKTAVWVTAPWVRIPLSPPIHTGKSPKGTFILIYAEKLIFATFSLRFNYGVASPRLWF